MDPADPKLEEARARLEELAKNLTVRFGLDAAARLLSGTWVGLVLANAGRGPCIEFLRELLDQVEQIHPEDT